MHLPSGLPGLMTGGHVGCPSSPPLEAAALPFCAGALWLKPSCGVGDTVLP